ncbi:FtsH protease activity modulator HflK [Pygmaiobacter massiliensis]|uniref:FtsH protease activity modulator HflK n=1 Tax=Pygmaiobacter massiliensis TaxID=1917873 RepID=UPI0028994C24|nr:FtsH protease activity modulator HflK [Pygmaiobacter massiliensis]
MGRKEKTILITIVANVILIILRFFLADLSGSIGLQANAWHSFTDVFVTSIVFIGLIITRYGAEKFKFASKKAENLLAIFVSIFIFYMGIEILSDALSGQQTELRYVPFVAAGAFVGVVINYFMARYKIYVGEQTGSESLMADGYHSKMDMYCSIAVLVGIIGSLFGMPDLDKVSAIVAMVLLMISGYEIFTSNLRMLLHPEAACENSGHTHHTLSFRENKKMVVGIGGVLAAAYFLSGVYIVQLDETGVVRRFGQVVNASVTPGIHYRLPTPVDQVTIIKSDNVNKIETGEQELLTGDTNLVNINLSVHYRIKNAADYVLNVKNTDQLIQSSAVTSIRKIIGESTIDYVLTEGKAEIENAAMELLTTTMDKNNTGIEIVGVQLVQAAPPASVVASFQDLATARQDKSIYINEATSYKNTIIPQANADAYKMVAEAEGYSKEKVQTAEGDAVLFSQKQEAYAASKGVTEFRLYMEAMEKVLPNVQKLLLGSGVNIDNAELWIANNKID